MPSAPAIQFPFPGARVRATTPIVVAGAPGATVTVTPDAGAPVSGTIDDSGHVCVLVTFTGTGAHSYTVAQSGTSDTASGSLVVPAPGDLYAIPSGATAADISAALAAHRYVQLTAGQTYALTQPVSVPSNVYFDLNGATIRLASGADCYMLRNANEAAGDEQIVVCNGTLDGNGLWQTRHLGSGSYLTDYTGMGAAVTKVNGVWFDGITLKEINAWGLSHWRCDLFLATNIVCDSIRRTDAALAGRPYPGNGDGITGSSRRVYVWNVSGFANDDMVAAGTGRSNMGVTTDTSPFYEIGIPDVDVDFVDIRNVTGGTKSGTNSWSGAALYATGGATIKNAVIEGLAGAFASFSYRLTDWWGDDALGKLRQVHVRNRTATAGWLTGGTPHEGDAAVEPLLTFDAILSGGTIHVKGWKTESETATVSVVGGTAGAVSYPDPTTFTCVVTPTLGADRATITATRSGGQSASMEVPLVPPLSLTAPPLDGTAAMPSPAFSSSQPATLDGTADFPPPALTARIAASPLTSSAALPGPNGALQRSASLGGGAALPAPAQTIQQAASIAAEAGFGGGGFAMDLAAAPLDGTLSMPEPRQAFHLGVLRRAALGSQQRRPWRIYDGRAWTDHRPRQFNGSAF